MTEFKANTAELKKALAVNALAVGKITSHIQSHALFSIEGDKCIIKATDEDRVAGSFTTLTEVDGGDTQFTADPKNLQKLLTGSGLAETRMIYDPDTKTLQVLTSENKGTFLSFASFDPAKFLSPSLDAQELKHTVIKEIFLDGMKYTQGFTLEKSEKFSDVHVIDGILYGSNGNTKVGGYFSPDFSEIPDLVLRKPMLSSIATMVDKTGITEIAIKTSEKLTTFHSPDDCFYFGFRKSTLVSPKFPISMKKPDLPKFNIDRAQFLKKLNSLSLTSWEDVGIKMSAKEGSLQMDTVADRPSFESVPCESDTEEPIEFIIQCDKFREVLGFFKASNIDIYVAKNKCTIYSDASIEIEEEGQENPVSKPFTAAALMTLARLVK